MGWSIGYDDYWERDVGYGVPALCDYPDCNKVIDRGLAYVCGGDVYGGEHGCGLFFCSEHRQYADFVTPELDEVCVEVCERCANGQKHFEAKPDIAKWKNGS